MPATSRAGPPCAGARRRPRAGSPSKSMTIQSPASTVCPQHLPEVEVAVGHGWRAPGARRCAGQQPARAPGSLRPIGARRLAIAQLVEGRVDLLVDRAPTPAQRSRASGPRARTPGRRRRTPAPRASRPRPRRAARAGGRSVGGRTRSSRERQRPPVDRVGHEPLQQPEGRLHRAPVAYQPASSGAWSKSCSVRNSSISSSGFRPGPTRR